MSEIKDPRIKLFGKTIELPEAVVMMEDGGDAAVPICVEDCSDQHLDCSSNSVLEDGNRGMNKEERGSFKSCNHAVDEPAIDDTSDICAGSVILSKGEEDHLEMNNSKEKSLKKPDKILPCPRCNSMDTKFCYFNNYNVSQPRHFCKKCQRYWTAGGTMRNVPVGAGRRKNKNAISVIRGLTLPEAAIQSAHVEISNRIHPKGTTLLTFSSDSSLCESMASALSTVDKTTGFHKHEAAGICVSHGSSKENGDDPSCGSSSPVAANTKYEDGLPPMLPNCHSFVQQVPCYSGTPWPFHWNSVQWRHPGSTPAFNTASFQVPVYSAPLPYWGCAVQPGSWSMPWIIPPTMVVASQSHTAQHSPTLGKHSRDDTILKQKDEEEVIKEGSSSSEKCLWVPKTLRINDPGEAAKSSIWATLGIKNDGDESVGGRSLFKAFQRPSKESEMNPAQQTTCPVLQANPAAFSRSVSFREST